jgi:hypothetical protein
MAGYVWGMYTTYDYAEIIKCNWTWNQSGGLQWSVIIDVNMLKMCVRLYIVLLY